MVKTIHIAPEVRAIFPEFRVFGIEVEELDRVDTTSLIGAFEVGLRRVLATVDIATIAQHGRIAIWRDAYRKMGLQASEFRSSIEQLLRRAARGGLPQTGIWIVDLYNAASLSHLTPIGGYDAAKVGRREIRVRPLRASDNFDGPSGGGGFRPPLRPGIFGYAVGQDIMCWALNCRDATQTMLGPNSRAAVFLSEAIDSTGAIASRLAIEELGERLAMAGAKVSPSMVQV
ncbi:MAG: hypothetical protein R3C31_04275 [Hyphomonadaceae bacterium]